MALINALVGATAQRDQQSGAVAVPQAGATSSITTGAASVNASLPKDSNNNYYPAVLITNSGNAAWIAFGTSGADAVVAGTSPAILIPANFFDYIAPPKGATNWCAIQDSAASKVCLVGVF